jgi:hypothetical protein
MPKASEVATELRKLADALSVEPDAEIKRPDIMVYHWGNESKEAFLTLCRLIPRPLQKKYTDDRMRVEYSSAGLGITLSVPRSAVCRIVEPAKPAVYECEPLLSDQEEATIS